MLKNLQNFKDHLRKNSPVKHDDILLNIIIFGVFVLKIVNDGDVFLFQRYVTTFLKSWFLLPRVQNAKLPCGLCKSCC